MKLFARSAVLLLPLGLCACGSRKAEVSQQTQLLAPPISETPEPKPDSTAAHLTPPESVKFPAPPPPKVVVKPQEPAKKPRTKKSTVKSAPSAATTAPPSQPAQVASNEVSPPEVSAVGTLTTGEPDAERKEARDEINAVEKGLSSISRKLNGSEEKTSSDIREYLKQALAALNTGDVEAAKNLTQKAKVLLSELTE
jgi:outer membrane biosynthesis protein TonB